MIRSCWYPTSNDDNSSCASVKSWVSQLRLALNIPNDWRTANVTAIFKKGERYKASNYRPVSLTSLCCKVQEHIIVSSILKHLDAHQILTGCQHGFRARRSCETQLLTLAHELLSSLDVGYQHDIIILDWSIMVSSFDRIFLWRIQSSAKSRMRDCTQFGRSFIKIRNNKGLWLFLEVLH
jgi:ribosomal protein L34